MARKPKSVYERIEEKQQEILEAQELLARLNNDLCELNKEKDDLEMHQLLDLMKAKGLNINEAIALFQSNISSNHEEDKKTKKRTRKESTTDEIEELSVNE